MMNVSSPPHSVARMRWLVHKGNVRHSNEMSPDSYQKGILGGNGHQSVRFGLITCNYPEDLKLVVWKWKEQVSVSSTLPILKL